MPTKGRGSVPWNVVQRVLILSYVAGFIAGVTITWVVMWFTLG